MLAVETSEMNLSLSGVSIFHFNVRMHSVQPSDSCTTLIKTKLSATTESALSLAAPN
jgi:hypothetical protein